MINMAWRRRRRRGRRGRFPKPVSIGRFPAVDGFNPFPLSNLEPIYIEPAELEVLRLVDLEGLSQEEAGERMGVSRGTIWRLLQSARKKSAQALTEARPLLVSVNGGNAKTESEESSEVLRIVKRNEDSLKTEKHKPESG